MLIEGAGDHSTNTLTVVGFNNLEAEDFNLTSSSSSSSAIVMKTVETLDLVKIAPAI